MFESGILKKSEWTPQNIRKQWKLCELQCDYARSEGDREAVSYYRQLQQQIENKMTPEQFSLEADDFSEVSEHLFRAVEAKVKEQERRQPNEH
jgi:hypothetical protein